MTTMNKMRMEIINDHRHHHEKRPSQYHGNSYLRRVCCPSLSHDQREEPDSNDIKNQKAPLSSAMSEFRSRLQVPAFATKYVDAATGRDWRGTLRAGKILRLPRFPTNKTGSKSPLLTYPMGHKLRTESLEIYRIL